MHVVRTSLKIQSKDRENLANTYQLKNNLLNKHFLKFGLINDQFEKYSNPKIENENDPGF